jgi:hypothetical protein
MRFPAVCLLMCLAVASYGCATAPEQAASSAPAAAAAAAPNTVPQPQHQARYRTGSRIPLSDDDGGAATVSGASRDAYEDDRRNMVTPQKW